MDITYPPEVLAVELEKYGISISHANLSHAQLMDQLAAYITDLINNNFNYLISLFYRMDISEKKLSSLLQQTKGVDAAYTIATVIIERQIEKLNTRRLFKKDHHIPDDEKW